MWKWGNGQTGLLYDCKLNPEHHEYVFDIPFNEFRNIEYLAKGNFGEVHKAIQIDSYYYNQKFALKRIYINIKIIPVIKFRIF